MNSYDHGKIEEKWQKHWEKKNLFCAENSSSKPKYYPLIEFPYPSGEGLHVGHPRPYIGMDLIARKRRAEGHNVLYPIGWDAFGLPAESYAIKTGIHPSVTTKKNIDNFRRQIKSLGISFDWSREVNTTDPAYYKWTQWLFLQFFKHGLAYKAKATINWCPKDKIGLANEEVIDGKCERCGTPVEKREKEQWMLAITKYADRLDKDLDTVDYLPQVKLQQRNWIGKSEGAEIDFKLSGGEETVTVFTTRPDTIFGATYLVLAPEHPMVNTMIYHSVGNKDEVLQYVERSKTKDEIERTAEGKEKTGVELKGIKAINPATKEEVPVWVADYVLPHYGTGAIMAVPADDARDEQFATVHNLPVVREYKKAGFEDFGKKVTKFKLRDWVFSRQRYWGEPIPVIHCEKCGTVPVPEKDLPVELPQVEKYEPTDSGESPLASIESWVNVGCPSCGGKAKRETDTMPNWAGSSWYYLRYTDPDSKKVFAEKEALDYWTPVDWYNGGMEHTTLHLLYSRFWHKFFFDIGLVPTSEPYRKRTSHGLILAEGGEKMSKSKGNVVNPDDIVNLYGADTLRLYEMFMGPFAQHVGWSTESIIGCRRFIERVWRVGMKVREENRPSPNEEVEPVLQKTIQKVSEDIESVGFNTAVSAMMICVNGFENQTPDRSQFESFLKLLAPFAPHVAEELWEHMGNKESITYAPWPIADVSKISQEKITFVIQVNGKTRATLDKTADSEENEVVTEALSLQEVQKWVGDKGVKRVIFVKNRLVNIIV